MRIKHDRTDRVTASQGFPYEAHLPPELETIKPKWIIPLSANYSAHIYEVQGFVTSHNENGGCYKKAGIVYEAHLLHNTSRLPHRSVSFSGYTSRREGGRFETLHDLRMAMDTVAIELRPKTVLRQESIDNDA